MNNQGAEHQFLTWFAYMEKRGMLEVRGSNFILNEGGARRFGLAAETENGQPRPVLGIGVYDAPAFKEITWNSAGIVTGYNFRDWIALFSKDVRPVGSDAPEPISLRIWIPLPIGSLDTFVKSEPQKLELRRIKTGKGGFPTFEKTPFNSLPLVINDKWKDLP